VALLKVRRSKFYSGARNLVCGLKAWKGTCFADKKVDIMMDWDEQTTKSLVQ